MRITRPSWRTLVPVICAAAGLMFATSAHIAHGQNLRTPDTTNLADLVRHAESQVNTESAQLAGLQKQVSGLTDQAATQDGAVAAAQKSGAPLVEPGGLTSVAGPGITVVLDDAGPSAAATAQAAGVDPNELLVHQSDIQAAVNALWAGGAEAMTVAGQRIIATSAVRCVGNTLLLNGRVFSPPYRVEALGDYGTMRASLDRSPGVILFKQAAGYYGLGFTVEQNSSLTLPGYAGPISLSYAKVAR